MPFHSSIKTEWQNSTTVYMWWVLVLILLSRLCNIYVGHNSRRRRGRIECGPLPSRWIEGCRKGSRNLYWKGVHIAFELPTFCSGTIKNFISFGKRANKIFLPHSHGHQCNGNFSWSREFSTLIYYISQASQVAYWKHRQQCTDWYYCVVKKISVWADVKQEAGVFAHKFSLIDKQSWHWWILTWSRHFCSGEGKGVYSDCVLTHLWSNRVISTLIWLDSSHCLIL